MTTTTERNEMFAKPTHRHLLKDVLLVSLVAVITAGFLAHAWRPAPRQGLAAVTPAAFLAAR